MIDLLFALVGFACGGFAMMIALDAKRKKIQRDRAENAANAAQHQQEAEQLRNQHRQFAEEMQRERENLSRHLQERLDKVRAFEEQLELQAGKLTAFQQQLDSRVISYKELES